ncbi:MAG TPA: PAS domain S-box protein [Thermoanaerobaculia bacterium]|jgi:PAS domain S-box-containing protein|nr:PAS domain S-box protein [Thermoanaerobaculia bacterium]
MSKPLRENEDRFRLMVEGIKDYAILMLDPDGFILSWNQGAEAITGYTAEEIIGQHFSRFYRAEDVARGWPEHELRVAKAEGRFEEEKWRVRKDGSLFWANVVITALWDEDGALLGFSKVTRDLTDRRRQEEAVRQNQELFRLMVEGVRDYAIFMLDPNGYIMTWNAGAERIKGYTAGEIIGHHFSRFYPPDALARRWPEHELKVAKAEGRFEEEGWRLRKDGTPFWANVVITSLYDQEGRLRGFAKVTRDLTERKRIEALEHAERQMNEFLAMLGHELRNPLAPIRNAVAMIQTSELSESNLRWASDVIDRQVTHLARLVDDLLDVSRITSGKISLRKEPTALAPLVTATAEASRPLIEARKHTLETVIPGEPLLVEGDPTRLSQIVMNLLNNAAKYTPEGGHIRLAVEKDGEQVLIRVRDTGIGIPEDLLPKVFNLFAQGERALDRTEGGLGIGLTLVRQLVQMHGGSVEAHSEGLGRGSEFVIRLPLFAAPPSSEHPSLQDTERSLPSGSRRVLVVDDNRDSVESMALLLQIWGHEIRTAYDGPEALAVAAEYRPDVVLLDIGLPGMNGYEVAQRLRELPRLERAVIVAVTGYGQESDRQRARRAGFDRHLVKPVDPAALQNLLATARALPQTC